MYFSAVSDEVDDELNDRFAAELRNVDGPATDLHRLMGIHLNEADKELRLLRWEALSDVLGEFTDLFDDQEKMVGHLFLEHGIDPPAADQSSDLVSLHASLHRSGDLDHQVRR
jgi:hypothetical protein